MCEYCLPDKGIAIFCSVVSVSILIFSSLFITTFSVLTLYLDNAFYSCNAFNFKQIIFVLLNCNFLKNCFQRLNNGQNLITYTLHKIKLSVHFLDSRIVAGNVFTHRAWDFITQKLIQNPLISILSQLQELVLPGLKRHEITRWIYNTQDVS